MRSLLFCDLTPQSSRRCHRRALAVLCAFCVSVTALLAEEPLSKEGPKGKIAPVSEQTTIKTERYLGVVTEPIPEALAAQLKDVLPSGRGLLVTRVLPDSPAGKAGMQPFDVLSAADAQPLASPDQLKALVTAGPAGQMLKLSFIRGAKLQVVDVQPGERTVSRLIHRHLGPPETPAAEPAAAKSKSPGAGEKQASQPAYSVGVQTRDGRTFQVEVRIDAAEVESPAQKFTGTSAEILARLKMLPDSIQRSVTRQMVRLGEDRQSLRTVQFRFQPRRDGNRQVLSVTLRKPDTDGVVKSFEMQHPMGDAAQPTPLEQVLRVPDFAAQLKELDPAVREKIEATLKTASLPAATVKVEQSQ